MYISIVQTMALYTVWLRNSHTRLRYAKLLPTSFKEEITSSLPINGPTETYSNPFSPNYHPVASLYVLPWEA